MFRIEKEHPGVVFVREYSECPESAISILKTGITVENNVLPTVILAKGLDAQRQWYLYQEVAPYCSNKETCPKPTVPKPVIKVDIGSPKLSRKCSKCKLPGHTKQNCST